MAVSFSDHWSSKICPTERHHFSSWDKCLGYSRGLSNWLRSRPRYQSRPSFLLVGCARGMSCGFAKDYCFSWRATPSQICSFAPPSSQRGGKRGTANHSPATRSWSNCSQKAPPPYNGTNRSFTASTKPTIERKAGCWGLLLKVVELVFRSWWAWNFVERIRNVVRWRQRPLCFHDLWWALHGVKHQFTVSIACGRQMAPPLFGRWCGTLAAVKHPCSFVAAIPARAWTNSSTWYLQHTEVAFIPTRIVFAASQQCRVHMLKYRPSRCLWSCSCPWNLLLAVGTMQWAHRPSFGFCWRSQCCASRICRDPSFCVFLTMALPLKHLWANAARMAGDDLLNGELGEHRAGASVALT